MPSRDPGDSALILKALDELEALHDSSTNQGHQNYYLKLALLELCGWVEQTQDKVLLRLASYWLEVERPSFETALKKNSGFSYEGNFRILLLRLIGHRGVELIENRLEQHIDTNVARVCAEMFALLDDTLKQPRNTHAHTFVGVQSAPLQNLLHFSILRKAAVTLDIGMQMFEREICGC